MLKSTTLVVTVEVTEVETVEATEAVTVEVTYAADLTVASGNLKVVVNLNAATERKGFNKLNILIKPESIYAFRLFASKISGLNEIIPFLSFTIEIKGPCFQTL
jgi:hypothetical protein